jgi:hypothetical protein
MPAADLNRSVEVGRRCGFPAGWISLRFLYTTPLFFAVQVMRIIADRLRRMNEAV